MRLLDLFCGAGGASAGYQRAGWEVVGVDHKPQPRYPFEFVQGDALEYGAEYAHEFDAIHASPPCQAFSALRHSNSVRNYPDLIEPTRELLCASGLPWVIENVPGAPLDHSIELCGSMFGLGAISGDGVIAERRWRQLRRHRRFELSFAMLQPPCQHDGSEAIGVYGNGGPARRKDAEGNYLARRGGFQGCADENRVAMGIAWMTSAELSQAIPPAYTELIGVQLMDVSRRLDRVA